MNLSKPGQVLLPLILLALPIFGNARQSVHPASPLCTKTNYTLECDYKGFEEPLQLDKLEAHHQVKKVAIHNAKQLTVSGTPCMPMYFSGISQITFVLAHICHKVENISLRVIDSKMNIVPKYVSDLYMEGSKVDWFDSEADFQSITIVNSRVGTLNVSHPLRDGKIVRIEHSTIDNFNRIAIENKAKLLMSNTTIKNLKLGSIKLYYASAVMLKSSIKYQDAKAVQLGPMSTVEVKDPVEGSGVILSGTFELPGDAVDPEARRAPGVPPPKYPRRPSHSTTSPLAWIVPTAVAMIEAMIIMVNCTNWFPGLKSTPKRRTTDEEGTAPGNYYDQSSVYFGSEDQSLNKRKGAKYT